jgi:3-hydroxymyristoyl/3-hydroxydecanoyl-(acyl carrier protein) dehydratase
MVAGRALLAVGFETPDGLPAKLDGLLALLQGTPLPKIFEDGTKAYLDGSPWPYAAVLLFEGREALQEELQLLKDALPGLLSAGGAYVSRRGSRLNLAPERPSSSGDDPEAKELEDLCRCLRRDSALRLAAKRITDRSPLDYPAFLDRFDFSFLRRPSWWLRVQTGMDDLPGRMGSQENHARIAALGTGQVPDAGQVTDTGQAQQPAQQTAPPTTPPAAFGTAWARALSDNLRAYRLYADNEMALMRHLGAAGAGTAPVTATAPASVPAHTRPEARPLYDREQILEITGGSIAKVLGQRYERADCCLKRARLPLPPFLFVDRVLALDATFGELRPSRIETAYDIPRDSILSMSESAVSYVLMTESSQIAILLLSIAGIDLMGDEVPSYRILDSTTRFHGPAPLKGDTLHSVLEFTDFKKSGETTLVSSRYACYNRGHLVLTQELTGGLFRESDLRTARGMGTERKPVGPASMPACLGGGARLRELRLDAFYEGAYGPDMILGHGDATPERLYVRPEGRMVDRILRMALGGGAYGLGMITAEKDLDANHWAFAVHFKNDPVFPGSLMAEAANQLQILFAISAGFIRDGKYRLGFVNDAPVKLSLRGQVTPEPSVLRYDWHVKSIRSGRGTTVLVSDCDILWKDVQVVRIEDLALEIVEVG